MYHQNDVMSIAPLNQRPYLFRCTHMCIDIDKLTAIRYTLMCSQKDGEPRPALEAAPARKVEQVMQTGNEAAGAWSLELPWPDAPLWPTRVFERGLALLRHAVIVGGLVIVGSVGLSMLVVLPSAPAVAGDAEVARGKYLVGIAGCNDCHTPGYFIGNPDMSRFLGGSEVGFEISGLGVFHGPNLTPDRETGLGTWSRDQIAAAITKGIRPDGRMLAPIMPWHAFKTLTRRDTNAIVAYLKSLPPVKNKVPGPFGPNEKPTSFVLKIMPPEGPAARK
jgi:mono/diheme cytochrome c family protein